MGFYGCIPRFIKAHASLILTILGGLGLVGTVVETARVAPKAENDLKVELNRRIYNRIEGMMDEAEAHGDGAKPEDLTNDEFKEMWDKAEQETSLSLMDKIKIAGPIYAPVILLGLGTLGCMAGAQILNAKQQAMLTMACAALSRDFSAYRQEIRDEYGAEADRKAYAESQKKVKALEAEVKRLENIKGVCSFGIATIPGLIFRSDMANVERAFLHFNRNLILRGWADLAELYSFLGVVEEEWKFVKKEPDENFGWNAYANEVEFGMNWLDYGLKEVETEDGQKAYLIYFDVAPYRIDGVVDEVGDIADEGEFYAGYDFTEAERMLRQGINQIPMLIDSTSHYVGAPMLCGW